MPGLALARPDHHTAPAYSVTLGPEVADLCEQVGYGPYPEQRLWLDDTFAMDGQGRAAAFESALITPRQQMKTGALKQASLGWLFLLKLPLVIWSAHEFDTASESFRDMENLVTGSDMLRRRIKRIDRANGSEAIETVDGCRLRFKARTKAGGRGLTGNRVVLDEGFALQPAHMGALLPTLASVPDPQVVYASSAGLLSSAVLRGIRDRGRAGADRLAYVEHLAERRPCASDTCAHLVGTPGCALDDQELWRQASPVHVRRDPSLLIVRQLREAMPPSEFARECLGWWDDPVGVKASGIDPHDWRDCGDADSRRVGAVALGVAQTPDRSTVSIGVAGRREDGRYHVELIEHRRATTTWVPQRVAELQRRHQPLAVVYDPMAAEAGLIPDLEGAGVEVTPAKVGDLAAATGRLYDLVKGDQLRHLGVQHDLNAAVDSAGTRDLPRGGWLWRQVGEAPIEPLRAVTLALSALEADLDYEVMDSIG